jgi:hypothetical protein
MVIKILIFSKKIVRYNIYIFFIMQFFFKITKYLTVKHIILGIITILVGTFFKFIIIPKIIVLFNVAVNEIIEYIVASFIALIVRLGIKDLLEQLVDILMPYLFMDTNSPNSSGNENGSEKPLNKGKGIATSTDSDSEKPLDKGKAKATNNDSDDAKQPLNKGKTKTTSSYPEIEGKKTLVFTTGNPILDQHIALSNRIKELQQLKYKRLLTPEEHSELLSLIEIAENKTNVIQSSDSYSASFNSSRSVSPSNHSSVTNDGFPPYNPGDYESDSGEGESSSKKK